MLTSSFCPLLQAEVPAQEEMRLGGVDGFVPYRPAATLLATALSPPPSIGARAALAGRLCARRKRFWGSVPPVWAPSGGS